MSGHNCKFTQWSPVQPFGDQGGQEEACHAEAFAVGMDSQSHQLNLSLAGWEPGPGHPAPQGIQQGTHETLEKKGAVNNRLRSTTLLQSAFCLQWASRDTVNSQNPSLK